MKLLLIVLMGSLGLMAQDLFPHTPSLSNVTFSSTPSTLVRTAIYPTHFEIYGVDGKLALKITSDGKVTFGEGITPNEAAKQFAEALEKYAGMKMCPEKLVILTSGNVGLGGCGDGTLKRECTALGAKK